MCPSQPPARCSLYDVEKSIYRSPRSLLVVVLKSSRGESILQRDVEKRDVDIPRDRESDSGRENAGTKKKRGNYRERVRVSVTQLRDRIGVYVHYKR